MRRLAPLVLIFLSALGCKDDKPKATDGVKSAQPVPSDMVFNDFLPTTGSSAGLGVRDSGLDGSLMGAGGGPGAEPGAGPDSAEKFKVLEQGSEPRAVRKYAFVANRVDKRLFTIAQSVTQTIGNQTAPGQDLTLKMALDFTPKQVKPNAQFEAKVTKFELPGAPPQMATALSAMTGLAGTFEVSPYGEVGEVTFVPDAKMKNQLAEVVMQSLSQTLELLVPQFPDTPIGVGAKWERRAENKEKGAEQSMRKTFTLKEVNAEGGVVEAEIEQKVPRRAQQTRAGTAFVESDVKGKYTYTFRFDRLASKVEGDFSATEKIEVNDPKAGKQLITQAQKAKHTIETAPAAGGK